MKTVEDLDVFKLAHQLALKTYSVTKTFPKEETFSLVDQMRRAASSVGMNLMEGAMRLGSKEYRPIRPHRPRFSGGSLLSADSSEGLKVYERRGLWRIAVWLRSSNPNALSFVSDSQSLATNTSHEHVFVRPTSPITAALRTRPRLFSEHEHVLPPDTTTTHDHELSPPTASSTKFRLRNERIERAAVVGERSDGATVPCYQLSWLII
jgi:hypothetical protein